MTTLTNFTAANDDAAYRACQTKASQRLHPVAIVATNDNGGYELRSIDADWTSIDIPEEGDITAEFADLVPLTDAERLVRIF